MKLVNRAVLSALLVVGAGLAASSPVAAYPPSCRQTFSQTNAVQALAGATAVEDLEVGVTGTVADIDVRLSTDLLPGTIVSLQAPDGPPGQSSELVSSAGKTFSGAIFDDEASGPVSGTMATPYTGRYRPVSALSALDGLQSARTWRVRVDNTGASTPAKVLAWSITITFAGCVPDSDSDGVPDAQDACRTRAAHTASGCPKAKRSLTATYKSRYFRGALSSPVAGCKAKRTTTIWKVHSGPDQKIGTVRTTATGSYLLKRAKKAGKYFAASPRVVVTDAAECPAVKSRTFTLG